MKLVYADDAGLFNSSEPFIVAAGVLVDGDKQLVALENQLDRIATQYIPNSDRSGFVFHATELWSGNKYFRDRAKWPLQKRLEILTEIARLPGKLEIPITFGFQDRKFIPHYDFPANMP